MLKWVRANPATAGGLAGLIFGWTLIDIGVMLIWPGRPWWMLVAGTVIVVHCMILLTES